MNWQHVILICARDLKYTLREKSTVAWLFLMPLLFTYFIGSATGGFGGGGARKDRIAVSLPADAGYLGQRVVQRLEDNGFEVVHFDGEHNRISEGEIPFERYARQLTVPANLTGRVEAGEVTDLRFASSLESVSGDYDDFRVQRAVYTVLADVVVAGRTADGLSEAGLATLDATARSLELEVRPAGKRREIPSGFSQTVPGILVMFTLLILLTSGSILLLQEREQGMLRRLAATPISQAELVTGKWFGKAILGWIQIGFAMVAGTWLFDMDWGPDLATVVLVLALWGTFCAGVAMVVGSVGRSEAQVAGIGVLASNVLAGLGGCWWPIEVAPEWMQNLQMALPTGWVMDALHRLSSFQTGPAEVIPHVITLTLGTLLVGVLAVRYFRYE